MSLQDNYLYGNISFFEIRNRNETRVIKQLPKILKEYPNYRPNVIDLQDIYALSLNKLPARYKQKGGLVLQETVKDWAIEEAVREAVEIVKENPNY